jgi:predicted acylesterase/phospholipase RssA
MVSNVDDLQNSDVTQSWQKILDYEHNEIEKGREEIRLQKNIRDQPVNAQGNTSHDLVGLAFSGGGIRSATFNLGIIQAFAELRLLRKIDYLSTVSGGGYIGSWLTSWMASHEQTDPTGCKESAGPKILGSIFKLPQNIWKPQQRKDEITKSIIDIENELAPLDANQKPVLANGSDEPSALRHLRSYTDYLKPHGGIFSLDAMTAFTTWLRNTFLNEIILVSVFSFILLLPLVMGSMVKKIIYAVVVTSGNTGFTETIKPFAANSILWVLVPLLLACATGFINLNILYKPAIENPALPWYSSQKYVLLLIILPLLFFSLLMTFMLPSLHQLVEENGFDGLFQVAHDFLLWPLTPSALFCWMLVACSIAFVISSPLRMFFFRNANRRDSSVFKYGIVFMLAALIGFFIIAKIANLLVANTTHYSSAVIANLLTFGPPLILCTFTFAVFVYVGLLGRVFDEHQREWWSNLVSMIALVAMSWLVLFGLAIWGVLVVDYLRIGLLSVFAWLATSGIGAALGKSGAASATGEAKGSAKWVSLLARLTPYVFIIGLCLIIAYVLNFAMLYFQHQEALAHLEFDNDLDRYSASYYARLAQIEQIIGIPATCLSLAALALLATGFLFSWRVDINIFSFHSFYRNRLTRAYLAAGIAAKERDKGKLPLTGMNDLDSPRLDRLPSRPYHILNTALNITSGKHLSWQERKAASFFFSKGYCGYFVQGEKQEDNYCNTNAYLDNQGCISLNLPMTISGAAASPNGGYHTSKPLAFLMTVFNVRLGWWIQNTAKLSNWKSRGPSFGMTYLFKELTGSVDENSRFIYLSDGGHFENLGIYELVRRKCRVIIASDAGADPDYQFEDLANAIRKCYIDLGARIEIDTAPIKPIQDGDSKGCSRQNFIIGEIHYQDSEETGVLLYIKASMCGNEATDIQYYKSLHSDFPHDPTANQFFTESQFESYRKLGYNIGRRIFAEKNTADLSDMNENAKVIFQYLGQAVKNKSSTA